MVLLSANRCPEKNLGAGQSYRTTRMKVDQAKEVLTTVTERGDRLIKKAGEVGRRIDKKHREIADGADTVAKASKVAAGIAVAGAAVSAPTGLAAVGVALGVVSTPLVVTAAPILANVAGVAITISAGASLYSKFRSRMESKEGA